MWILRPPRPSLKLLYSPGLITATHILKAANYQLAKLQRIQNMGCRIIYNLRKYDHITEEMQDLYQLLVPERIPYKFVFSCFKY